MQHFLLDILDALKGKRKRRHGAPAAFREAVAAHEFFRAGYDRAFYAEQRLLGPDENMHTVSLRLMQALDRDFVRDDGFLRVFCSLPTCIRWKMREHEADMSRDDLAQYLEDCRRGLPAGLVIELARRCLLEKHVVIAAPEMAADLRADASWRRVAMGDLLRRFACWGLFIAANAFASTPEEEGGWFVAPDCWGGSRRLHVLHVPGSLEPRDMTFLAFRHDPETTLGELSATLELPCGLTFGPREEEAAERCAAEMFPILAALFATGVPTPPRDFVWDFETDWFREVRPEIRNRPAIFDFPKIHALIENPEYRIHLLGRLPGLD